MTIIYGVDSSKLFAAADVRDAIVECFAQAHKEALEDLKEYVNDVSLKDFEEIKRINVRQLVRSAFYKTGGDYDKPTKESIINAMEELKSFAQNFRNQEIIQKHYSEISKLVEKLK